MKTFFVLILISFKLLAFPIGDGKAMFASDTKSTHLKEYQNAVNIASFDEELTEKKESEHDSTPIVTEKLSFNFEDIFSSLLVQRNNISWVYSPQLNSDQQLYRLYSNFRI
ncbi:hypothetical protein [Emticicia sp. SJ17W-69]|uniref:hypothetical protein n=1 Tax=Emticicia sp. SJ17W-69 TaxID=3421657 RepID=UPI003EC0CA40